MATGEPAMVQGAATAPTGPAVSSGAWWALAVLTAVSFFNYMDRMVLAVLLEPIKAELGLSDSQLGLLSGLAFAAFYATLGIPLARLADRTSRVRLLAVCVATWSLMTAATGLARSFGGLFLARVGVGVGEAGCVPAAHSLIGDYMPGPRRALGISVFQAGGLAGLSGGLILTGLLADQLGWRAALFAVGLAGVPLALIIALTLREPARQGHDAPASTEPAGAALRALLGRPALRHLVLALSVGAFATYGLTQWIPAFFIRVHGLSLTQIGLWSGTASGVGGILGVMLGGWLATRLIPRDPRWELWLPAIAYGGSAPLYAAVFLAPSPFLAIGIKLAATFLAASGGGVALSAIQSFAEPHRRATAVSLTLFLSSLLGLGLGPWLVGVASDALAPALGRESLRYALLISTAALLWAGLHFLLSARRALRDRLP
ncbi:MAG: MFS transporter [Phenylobacterium sp.]|uniref:spinster family MFS transporter n=1 Tax=Phenylobacterium sp. TaxID=1871053 RepID=UPI001A4979D1|nr:MFS transporter [Phenylobacterium sp.]MBL8772980.1 MFS transporter [Phenylobacterium sp.]